MKHVEKSIKTSTICYQDNEVKEMQHVLCKVLIVSEIETHPNRQTVCFLFKTTEKLLINKKHY